MDLPDLCFCGCGESRDKLDATNMEGILLTVELGRWLNFVTVMDDAGGQLGADTEGFIEDGHDLYRSIHDEVHGGIPIDRRTRKQRRRWVKFSQKSRKKISKQVPADEPDPFDLPSPHPSQTRAWVMEGELRPIED